MCLKRRAKEMEVPTEEELLMEELTAAKAELKIADQNFNNATVEYFDIANAELTAARNRFEAASAKLKKFRKENPEAKNTFTRFSVIAKI